MVGNKPGKVYGLVGSSTQRRLGQKKPLPARSRPSASAFGGGSDDDDDDEEDHSSVAAVNKRLREANARREAKEKHREAHPAAEGGGGGIYDYDEVYDEMQGKRAEKQEASAEAAKEERKQSKYIGSLLKQAKMREVQNEKAYERKLLKEREAQDEEIGASSEVYVTESYKKKLKEMRKWDLQEKNQEKEEERTSVDQAGMDSFYLNFNRNIATGASVSNATSAFTVGSDRNTATLEYGVGEKGATGDNLPSTTSPGQEGEGHVSQNKRAREEDGGGAAGGDDHPAEDTVRNEQRATGELERDTQRDKAKTEATILAAKERAAARKRAKQDRAVS